MPSHYITTHLSTVASSILAQEFARISWRKSYRVLFCSFQTPRRQPSHPAELLEEGELGIPEEEEEYDEMDIDDTIDSGLDGIGLHCVDWDDEGIQALLNIDWTLVQNTATRPESDRKGWIGAKDAYRILISEGDDLAAALKKALCIA